MVNDDSVLIVDDDADILVAGKLMLKRHFTRVATCADPGELPALLAGDRFTVILLDMNFSPGDSSGKEGFYWLQRILEHDPDAVVVMITAHGDVPLAVEAIKRGATDFIAKPWENERVVATLQSASRLHTTRREAQTLKRRHQAIAAASAAPGQALLGESAVMSELLSVVARTAPTEANVLVLGENGTGKELLARRIHQQSRRVNEVFMAVDLGAVAEGLFESELFGHRKGAFTGADRDRVGRLEAANSGTLFLDEIGNLPLHLQAKLLTVLEQRQVVPLGSNRPVPIDVRLISATNLSREQLMQENRFRQDLLFRLNTVELLIPPLRARREDIALIARHYLDYYNRKYGRGPEEFSAAAMRAMTDYNWPGNVRALRHAVERAVIMATGNRIEAADLQLGGTLQGGAVQAGAVQTGAVQTGVDPGAGRPDPAGDDLNLERIERQTIQSALERHRYNISHTARALGLTRAALYRRMEKHGL